VATDLRIGRHHHAHVVDIDQRRRRCLDHLIVDRLAIDDRARNDNDDARRRRAGLARYRTTRCRVSNGPQEAAVPDGCRQRHELDQFLDEYNSDNYNSDNYDRPHQGPGDRDQVQQRVTQVVNADLLAAARAAIGFMPDDEGLALHDAAARVDHPGPMLEIGAYCGKSAVYLGAAARERATVLFSLDHHRGSEENQAGWEHHDTSLVDPRTGRMDTLPVFRRTIEDAGLEDVVIAIVGASTTTARQWSTPLSLLFIDGGHGRAVAHADYDHWVQHVAVGGVLAIHDVFPDPADGGTPPYEIYLRALASRRFEHDPNQSCGSLRILACTG
jgi:MMP 1-O-methyltransferase